MLEYSILKPEGILLLTPTAPLSRGDFAGLGALVDGYLANHTGLHGVLVHSESFPGWDSFASFTAHVRFLRDHERKLDRVAIVTDSPIAGAAEALAQLFISADIRHFAFVDYKSALAWLKAPRDRQDGHEHDVSAGITPRFLSSEKRRGESLAVESCRSAPSPRALPRRNQFHVRAETYGHRIAK